MRISYILSIAAVSALVIPQNADQPLSNDRHIEARPTASIDSNGQQEKRQPTFGFLTADQDVTETAGKDMLTRWLSAWRKLHGLPTESGAMPWTSPSSPSSPAKPSAPAAPQQAAAPLPVTDNSNGTSSEKSSYVPLPDTSGSPASKPDKETGTPIKGKDDKSEDEQSTPVPSDPASTTKEKRQSTGVPPFVPVIPVNNPTTSFPKLPLAPPSGAQIGAGSLVGNVGTGLGWLLPGPLGGGLNALLKGVGSDIASGKKPPKLQRVQPAQTAQPAVPASSFPTLLGASMPLVNPR